MTTVVYRDGTLATDSRCTDDDGFIVSDLRRKIVTLKSGGYAVGVGAWAKTGPFIRWLDGGEGERPDLGTGAVIQLQADGAVRVHELGGDFVLDMPFAAWGSGSPAATAAMHAGCTAVRAVEIAAMVDPATGGEVVSVSIPRGYQTTSADG